MAVDEIIRGVSNNPFQIIGASEKIGRDATIYEKSEAGDGIVARVIGPNKVIMDTGYFPKNTLLGVVRPDIKFWSSVVASDQITFEVWRKNPQGYEELVDSRDVDYVELISNHPGSSCGTRHHSVNYEYRFIVKSHSTIADNTVIEVDFLRITVSDLYATTAHNAYPNLDDNTGAPLRYTVDSFNLYSACAGHGPYWTTQLLTTYDCRDATITVTAEVPTDIIVCVISVKAAAGFVVKLYNMSGGVFTDDAILNVNIIFSTAITSV